MTPHPLDDVRRWLGDMDARLGRIEAALRKLSEAQPQKETYSTKEAARILKLAPYTVREYCRQGRLQATQTRGGRGNRAEYRLSHAELLRYQSEGLLPNGHTAANPKPR